MDETGAKRGETGQHQQSNAPEEPSVDVDVGIKRDLVVHLVNRVASLTDRDPMDLPPIAREIDIEAASRLAANEQTTLGFTYAGCEVFIGREGLVTVSRQD